MPPETPKRKGRTIEQRSIDPAAQAMLIRADELGLDTAFTRAEQMAPCPIGAEGEAQGYKIRDPFKLKKLAEELGIPTDGRPVSELAHDVGEKCLAQFSQQRGEIAMIERAPKKRKELWRKLKMVPRGIDREIVDILHRTHMGDDQDAEHILAQGMRAALGDGWGGSMIATALAAH